MELPVTNEDFQELWNINPVAKLQLESIIQKRLLEEAHNKIRELEAQQSDD